MPPEQEEEFWQEEIETLPVLTDDIPDEKFRVGRNYNSKLNKNHSPLYAAQEGLIS